MHLESFFIHQRDDTALVRQGQRLADAHDASGAGAQHLREWQSLLLGIEQRPSLQVDVVRGSVQQRDNLDLR